MTENQDHPIDGQPDTQGVFLSTLQRNNTQIRKDRALVIYEDAKLVFRRKIEDLQMDRTRITRQREAMLDLAPANTTSMTMAEFDPAKFVEEDLKLGIEIRNIDIKLEVAVKRYEDLFGALPISA